MKTGHAATYQRQRKAAFKAQGLCTWCGKVPPSEGKTRCEACLVIARKGCREYFQRRRGAWRALGICQVCGIREALPSGRRCRCAYCAEQQDEYKAKRRAA